MRFSSKNKISQLSKSIFLGAVLTTASSLHAQGIGNSPSKMVTASSGLKYQDLVLGNGETAAVGRTVEVHYTGWLQNPDGGIGKKFDSSKDRGDPFVFPLGEGRVIRGWDEGVAGMQVGGKRELIVPAALGYGARGAANVIPPNATLIFDVELLGIK